MPPGLPAKGSGLGRGEARLIQGLTEDFLEERMLEEGFGGGGLVAECVGDTLGRRTCVGRGLEVRPSWQVQVNELGLISRAVGTLQSLSQEQGWLRAGMRFSLQSSVQGPVTGHAACTL